MYIKIKNINIYWQKYKNIIKLSKISIWFTLMVFIINTININYIYIVNYIYYVSYVTKRYFL